MHFKTWNFGNLNFNQFILLIILIINFLKFCLFCNFSVKLMLVMNLNFSRISRRKTPIYRSFSTKYSLLRLSILVHRLLRNLSLFSYLILIIDSINSSLTVLTHRNKLLIWIFILVAILCTY